MHRVLSSLLVLLMTFALITHSVAAPLMHLHSEQPVPVAVQTQEHDHADCGGLGVDTAVDEAQPVDHGNHDHAVPAHGKGCDTNGACCGPLALTAAPAIVAPAQATPQPHRISSGTGVNPTNPDRPPSLPLA